MLNGCIKLILEIYQTTSAVFAREYLGIIAVKQESNLKADKQTIIILF